MRFHESEIVVFATAHLLKKSSREVFLVSTRHPHFNYPTFLHRVWEQADNVERIVLTAKAHCYFVQKRVLSYSSGAKKKGQDFAIVQPRCNPSARKACVSNRVRIKINENRSLVEIYILYFSIRTVFTIPSCWTVWKNPMEEFSLPFRLNELVKSTCVPIKFSNRITTMCYLLTREDFCVCRRDPWMWSFADLKNWEDSPPTVYGFRREETLVTVLGYLWLQFPHR